MSTLSDLSHHSVFPAEQRGDTLVVTPQGDVIGFSQNQIQIELRVIEKLLQKSSGMHLLVDLGHTNYFGSEMIGLINRLGLTARKSGGKIAMCNISDDMRDILNVMNFDRIWEYFGTTGNALGSIATISIAERLSRLKKITVGILSVAAVAAALIYYPWPNRDREYYQLIISYSNELTELRKTPGKTNQRKRFRIQVKRKLKPILRDLASDSQQGNLAASYLYAACRDNLYHLLEPNVLNRLELEQKFLDNMSEAAKYIEGVTPPTQETFGRENVQTPSKQSGQNESASRQSSSQKR